MRTSISRCLLALAALVTISGCSGQSSPASPATVTSKPVDVQPTAATSQIRVTDAAGRIVELPKLPQRIVVMGQGPYMPLHTLYMFPEIRQRLVAVEKKGGNVSDFLPLLDPNFSKITVLNTNPGPEEIAAQHPDLVIMKGLKLDQWGTPLVNLGIPVVYLGLETPDLLFKDIANVGILLGNEARAKEIIVYYQSKLDLVRGKVAKIDQKSRPKILTLSYDERTGTAAVQVPPAGWMQTIEAQTAGGDPVWLSAVEGTSNWTVTNMEQIATWNPDKIFVIVYFNLDASEVLTKLKADPKWKALKAVQNNQIYAYPTDLYGWDTPEPRWILGIEWLAKKMYPDSFADMDLTEEMNQFFAKTYGMDPVSIKTNILPKVRIDGK